ARMAPAPIISSHLNVGAGEPFHREKLRGRARALKYRDCPAASDQGLHDSGKNGDAEAARDADRRLVALQLEAAPEGSEQVQLVALASGGQPGASGADDVEDEADVSARRIGPGGAVGTAQDGVRRGDGQLEELRGVD